MVGAFENHIAGVWGLHPEPIIAFYSNSVAGVGKISFSDTML